MAIVEERPGTIIGDIETGPKEAGMGKQDTGHNLGGPVDAQDPVLPSTSSQQLGPTRPGTGTLASAEAVEMRALTSQYKRQQPPVTTTMTLTRRKPGWMLIKV